MKKIFLTILFSLLFCSCGTVEEVQQEKITTKTETEVKITEEKQEENIPSPAIEPTIIPTVAITETPIPTPYVEEKIQLIFSAFLEDETIESYVENKNLESENENTYYVYDESHYYYFLNKSEAEKNAKECTKEYCEREIISLIKESYPYVYQKVEADSSFTNVNLYVDKKKYDETMDFGVAIIPIYYCFIISDVYQAYHFVDVSTRNCIVNILDIETNELIYTTE